MAMKLSTGRVAFPIEFDNGDKDVIYFNPNDPDLAVRPMNSKDNIDKRINEMNAEDFEMLNDGEATAVNDLKNISELDEEKREKLLAKAEKMTKIVENTKTIIFEELNRAFDSDVSSVVFKHCSPFAVVGGEYFISQFLNAIIPEIKKHMNKSNAELEKKMSKHLDKYRR